MTLEHIRSVLKDRNLRKVAETIKVHPNCLYRLVNGVTDPRTSTIEKVLKYLNSQVKH